MGALATFEYEEFIPKKRMCDNDRKRYHREKRDLDASRYTGDPDESIEDADTQS